MQRLQVEEVDLDGVEVEVEGLEGVKVDGVELRELRE